MTDSIPLYAFRDTCSDFIGIIWDTEFGKIVTVENKMSINGNLDIREINTGNRVDNVDLRSLLMSILPLE